MSELAQGSVKEVSVEKLETMEEELRKSEEKYRVLTESVSDVFFALDHDLRYTYWNKASEKLTGILAKDAIGKSLTEVFPDLKGTRVEQFYLDVLRTKQPQSLVNKDHLGNKDLVFEINAYPTEDGLSVFCKDITESKNKEEEFVRLSNAVKMSTDGIVITDLYARIVDANEAIMRMYGAKDRSDLIGKSSFELIVPEEREKAFVGMKEVLEKGYSKNQEYHIIAKDGGRVLAELNSAVMRKPDGEPVGFVAVVRDITRRKQMEESVRESEAKFRDIFESANDCLVYLDRLGRILDVNEKGVQVFGGSKDELMGKHFSRVGVISPKGIPSLLRAFADGLADRHTTLNLDIRNKKGERISLECSGSLLKKADNLALLVVARDVTERKRMEETLRESEGKYRKQFEEALDAIFLADAQTGIVLDCNRAATELVGREKSELIGEHQRILHPPEENEEEFSTTFKQHLKEKMGQVLETQVITKKGEIKDVAIKANVFELGSKKVIQGIFRDITELKRAEKTLRESQQKFERLFMFNPEAAVFSDANDYVLNINPRFTDLFGYSPVEAQGKPLDNLIVPDDLKEEAKRLTEIREGYVYHDTVRKRKDGSLVQVSISCASIVSDGKCLGNVVLYKDITERKQMEKALERQRDIAITLSGAGSLDQVVNCLFDHLLATEEFDCAAFYLFDQQTGTLDMIAHRGLLGKFAAKVSRFDSDSPYTKVVLDGKPLYQKTSDFPSPIREDIQSSGIVSVAAIPIHYERKPIGHLNMASHTHEKISASTRHVLESVSAQIGETIARVRMEERLRQYSEHLEELVQRRTTELLESETRYSVLVEEASDGVVIVQDGKTIFANKKAQEVTGYSRDELANVPVEKMIDEKYSATVKEQNEKTLKDQMKPTPTEAELIAKNGERVPVEGSPTLINYQGRPAVLVIWRDLRARKKLEKERLRLQKLAAIGELATMVGHDLRNPLQSIENAAYYLSNELPRIASSLSDPQKTTQMLQAISNSVNYADKIVRDLQDFSATRTPTLKKASINDIVEETLQQAQMPNNVELRTELSNLPEIEVDKDQVKRIFVNLLANGIQALENRVGTLTVSTNQTGNFVEISFKDTGIGIPREKMGKLFTPLFTTKAKGMGMGLPICKKFVENHGGTIRVESEVGEGTAATVKLPITRKAQR